MSGATVFLGSGAGVALGVAYFGALRASAPVYLTNTRLAIALGFARLAIAVAGFGVLVALRPEALLPALGTFTASGLVAAQRGAEAKS